mmetsp:Transcript_96902/g.177202  ORF Transcript_96902/g.177202 Transcript_96902/m.177202 type:complete len:257 (+) Transcript_96902:378-1148(+)
MPRLLELPVSLPLKLWQPPLVKSSLHRVQCQAVQNHKPAPTWPASFLSNHQDLRHQSPQGIPHRPGLPRQRTRSFYPRRPPLAPHRWPASAAQLSAMQLPARQTLQIALASFSSLTSGPLPMKAALAHLLLPLELVRSPPALARQLQPPELSEASHCHKPPQAYFSCSPSSAQYPWGHLQQPFAPSSSQLSPRLLQDRPTRSQFLTVPASSILVLQECSYPDLWLLLAPPVPARLLVSAQWLPRAWHFAERLPDCV